MVRQLFIKVSSSCVGSFVSLTSGICDTVQRIATLVSTQENVIVRNVGGMGENTLPVWTNQVGIIANKVGQDETGWDFLLEFPRSHLASLYNGQPLDQSPFPLQCLVQVKSTDQRPGKWDVKLDNWVRLVKSPLPAFFLFLNLTRKKAVNVHFWFILAKNIFTVYKRGYERKMKRPNFIRKLCSLSTLKTNLYCLLMVMA